MIAAKRARLRWALRDVAGGTAFASMAISGQVPAAATISVALSLTLALAGYRPFRGRESWTALVLGAVGLGLYGLVGTGHLDLVVAACTFAGAITAHRVLSGPSRSTDNQVLLTSLMMLAGGAALSGEMGYALCLIAFSACASFSLGLAILEDYAGGEAEVPIRPLMRQLAIGLVFSTIGAAIFFAMFPRLSWNISAKRVTPGMVSPVSGLGDTVRLGGSGTIKTNPRIVLRAALTPDPHSALLGAYWIARTFDRFNGDEWTSEPISSKPAAQVTLRAGGRDMIHQRIELTPAYGAMTLVALEPVSLLGNAVMHSPSGSAHTELIRVGRDEVRFEDRAIGYAYHAYSLASDEVPLRKGERLDTYLQLPEHLDPRVRALAAQIAGSLTDPLAIARALERRLRDDYAYSLELSGDVPDPLADFLFVRKSGHCEHFATALTVMLRTLQIPARVVGGFYGGERLGDEYVVRAGDAHTWVQAFIPGHGLITLDATPPSRRGVQATPLLEWAMRLYESVEDLWRRAVVDYSFADQAHFATQLMRPSDERSSTGSSIDLHPTRWMWPAVAIATTLIFGWGLVRRRSRRPHPAATFLDGIEKTIERAKLREPEELLEQTRARLRARHHPAAPALERVTRRYLEARFGGRPLMQGEASSLTAALVRALNLKSGSPRP